MAIHSEAVREGWTSIWGEYPISRLPENAQATGSFSEAKRPCHRHEKVFLPYGVNSSKFRGIDPLDAPRRFRSNGKMPPPSLTTDPELAAATPEFARESCGLQLRASSPGRRRVHPAQDSQRECPGRGCGTVRPGNPPMDVDSSRIVWNTGIFLALERGASAFESEAPADAACASPGHSATLFHVQADERPAPAGTPDGENSAPDFHCDNGSPPVDCRAHATGNDAAAPGADSGTQCPHPLIFSKMLENLAGRKPARSRASSISPTRRPARRSPSPTRACRRFPSIRSWIVLSFTNYVNRSDFQKQ